MTEDSIMTPRFYIIMREDIANMNPGKAIAQGSHAQAAFMVEKLVKEKFSTPYEKSAFEDWMEQGDGFGTTITLVAPLDTIVDIRNEAMCNQETAHNGGMVVDTSYPDVNYYGVRFLRETVTCGWFFGYHEIRDTTPMKMVSELRLHP